MSFFKKASGILGLNARNLLFLSEFNSRANRKLADDKLYTKHFLSARGIGVPKLYATIRSLQELRNFNPKKLPKSFVVKPNRGYGGEGIIAIHDTRGKYYYDSNGDRYTWEDFYQHIVGILDGHYAVSGLHDIALFEERLVSHEYFNNFMEQGLPDIRIIVFNYVPVIAMLRLPTNSSRGKANLHLGAIGIGIDLGSGQATFGVIGNKLIKKLPNGESIRKIFIPDWHDLLLTASKTQYITQIGYLAVDLALTKSGIKILELNARAGLAIQISNQALLRQRLGKVDDLKVASPEEGVRIAQTLFTRVAKKDITKIISAKPIIGLYEKIDLLNTKNSRSLIAKIDPHSQSNLVDNSLEILPNSKLLSLKLKGIKLRLPFQRADLKDQEHQVILSGRYLTDFLIDTAKTIDYSKSETESTSIEEKIILNIDNKLYNLESQLHLLAKLKPINLDEEYRSFIKNPDYSPHFRYKEIDTKLDSLKKELKKIPHNVDHPLMPLYDNKSGELYNKISLLQVVGHKDIMEFSEKIYGTADENLYSSAINFIKATPLLKDTSKVLKIDEVMKRINQYLAEKKLSRWKIKILDEATAGMQITSNNTILIYKKAKISTNRLKALIAHEIETHIFRMENGRLQQYKLFQQGTAGYLATEEGLSIYNQNKLNLSLGEKFFTPALNTIAIYLGKKMPFVELYHHLLKIYAIDKDRAWRICLRVKRGLGDTSEPAVFTKDVVYFTGHRLIEQLIKDKGINELKKLYVGKISIADLKYITDFRQWPIKYFPE